MIYCMSDIHGELDKFEQMLELIQLSDCDHLYIIGDAIDRGPRGVEVLQKIIATNNISMLLGNHELMCLNTLGPLNEYGARELWKQNGGTRTYRDLVYRCSPHERNQIIRYLMNLHDSLNLTVAGRRFHLVHGCPGADHQTRIWGRVTEETRSPFQDTICVVGHTPTVFFTNRYDENFSIWHGNGIINIDCGCGNLNVQHRRLACLRLDDMAEFYVGGVDGNLRTVCL